MRERNTPIAWTAEDLADKEGIYQTGILKFEHAARMIESMADPNRPEWSCTPELASSLADLVRAGIQHMEASR